MALDTNLVSYWKFDESSGNAADAVGSNTLTNNNTATFATGKINNAADLELSSTQYFSIADASQSGLDFSSTWSLSGWVNLESNGVSNFIASKDDNNQRSYVIRIQANDGGASANRIVGQMFSSLTTNARWEGYGSTQLSTGTWYHVVVTFDASGPTMKMYVNGVEETVTITVSTFSGTIQNGTAPFQVGADTFDGGKYDGMIDELGVWSRVLSQSDVTALYNGGAGSAYPFSTAYIISAAVGEFALTGIATLFNKTLSMVSDAGTFILTGIAAGLSYGYTLVADTGSFVLTGIDALFNKTLNMVAAVGEFALTGIAALFPYGRMLAAEIGSYILTGKAIRVPLWLTPETRNSVTLTAQSKNSVTLTSESKNSVTLTAEDRSNT